MLTFSVCISQDRYVGSRETEAALLTLKGKQAFMHTQTVPTWPHMLMTASESVDEYLDEATEDTDVRKRLRPLLDVIRRLKHHSRK